MARMFRLIVLSYVGLVVFVLVNFGPNSDVEANQHRAKRYLAFLNISRFYIRLNTKAAMVPWTQIFTQAVGFRVNWDEAPDTFRPYKHLVHRRDLYTPLQMLLDRNGISGFHCIRRAICELDAHSRPPRVYHKILKIIFRYTSPATDRWHNRSGADCQESMHSCPFSILEASMYTDL
ncbi:uncharacterized protein LOC119693212 [Plutella xylostella]|uniref:uncharacterized protein LOC119693212 n=1 Tax=Plutella xylostella TaxID=51655 RepID=UPI0020328FC8|nr:uncharacterized protein LOC119693212 [Plutella xylostella]